MEWESGSPRLSHIHPGQEHWSPGRRNGWELGFGNGGVNPGQGLLLTAGRRIRRRWGRRWWWEMPVEESQAATEARWYCWVTSREWSHHHRLSLLTCLRQQLNNREPGPSNTRQTELQSTTPARVLPKVPDALICRVATQPGAHLHVPDTRN